MPVSEPSIIETIFEQSIAPTIILRADAPNFTVVDQNEEYRMFAPHDTEIAGLTFHEAYVHNHADDDIELAYTQLVTAFQDAIATKAIVKLPAVKFLVKDSNGMQTHCLWRQMEAIPILDKQGEVAYLSCPSYDISKQVLLETARSVGRVKEQDLTEELAASNEELSATNEELTAANEELRQNQEGLHEINLELEARVEERTKALSVSEARFRTMVEQSPVPMLVTMGENMVFEIINQPMLELIGKDQSVIGMPWHEAMPELEGQDIIRQLLDTYDSGKSWVGDEVPVMIYKTGSPVLGFYNITYKPLEENGKTIGMLQSAIDVTELVKARLQVEETNQELQSLNEEMYASNEELAATNEEMTAANEALIEIQDQLTQESAEHRMALEKLRASEQNIRNMVLQAPVGMCIIQGDPLKMMEINDGFLAIIGKTRQELTQKAYWDAIPEAAAFYEPITNRVITTGETYHANEHEIMLVRQGVPETVYVDFVYEPMKDTDGKPYAIMIVAIDVTDKVTARKKIAQAEESLRMATESGELATWYLNEKLGTITASARFNEIFGFNLDEQVPYTAAIDQIHPDYRQMVMDAVNNSFLSGARFNVEYPITGFNDDKLRWVRSVGKMVADSENGNYITGVMADITEQKMDDIRKNDFIGMVSHELKTPLTSLNAYLQMLNIKATKAADHFTVNALEQSVKQVKKMTSMINGFLNVTRLESGKIQIDKQHFDMAELVKESESETILMNSAHTFIFHPVEPTPVFADEDKIGQVINNLISNAVKYSKPGSTIQIACVTEGGLARFSVSDEGIGIEQRHLDQLFKRYYRVENTSHIAGFGIGLYLSAEIIERHDGQIWAESKPGKGSTFYFTLPVQQTL